MQTLTEENERLRKIIESEVDRRFKSYSSQKIKYFTGLPSLATFMALHITMSRNDGQDCRFAAFS